MAYRKDYVQPQQGDQGFARTMKCFGRRINFAVADMTLASVVGAFVLPANFMVLGIFGKTDALGTSLAVSVGTPATPALLLAGQSLAAAGAISTTQARRSPRPPRPPKSRSR